MRSALVAALFLVLAGCAGTSANYRAAPSSNDYSQSMGSPDIRHVARTYGTGVVYDTNDMGVTPPLSLADVR